MFKEARDLIIDQIKDDKSLVAEVCMNALQSNSMSRELIEDFDMKFARQHKNFSDETKNNLNNYRSNIRCNLCYYFPVAELLAEFLNRKQMIDWFSYELIRCIVYDAPLGMYFDDNYLMSGAPVESDTVLDLHISLLRVINNSAKIYFKDNPPEEHIEALESEISGLETANNINKTTLYSGIRKSIGKIVSGDDDIIGTVCSYELSIVSQKTVLEKENLIRLKNEINLGSFHMSLKEYELMLDYVDARQQGTSTFMSVSQLVEIKISRLNSISKFVREIIRGAVNRNDDMVTNEKMHYLVGLFERGIDSTDDYLMPSFIEIHSSVATLVLTSMEILREAKVGVMYDSSLFTRLEVGTRKLGKLIKYNKENKC